MTYRYLYQDKENRNCEGEIKARDRNEAYLLLRKRGIRPYRVIGDDPWNWRPWAVVTGYAILLTAIVVLVLMVMARQSSGSKVRQQVQMTAEEAAEFRAKAEDAVYRAPEAYRYNVWKGVNARLEERGLEPIACPEGLDESL